MNRPSEKRCLPPPAEPADAEVVEENFLTPLDVARLQSLVDCGDVCKAAKASRVSECTFKNQLAWIRAKLGVNSTLEAVIWAFRKGLVK